MNICHHLSIEHVKTAFGCYQGGLKLVLRLVIFLLEALELVVEFDGGVGWRGLLGEDVGLSGLVSGRRGRV